MERSSSLDVQIGQNALRVCSVSVQTAQKHRKERPTDEQHKPAIAITKRGGSIHPLPTPNSRYPPQYICRYTTPFDVITWHFL
jgi:hypothetical protein